MVQFDCVVVCRPLQISRLVAESSRVSTVSTYFHFLFVFAEELKSSLFSQVVDIRNCMRAENRHNICFLFTHVILLSRHSWLKGASRVFSHQPFKAGWQDEWFLLISHGGGWQLSECHQYAGVITDEVLSI